MERLGLDTIKVGFVYNIVLCRKSVIGADRSWDRANGQDLRCLFVTIFFSLKFLSKLAMI